MNTALADTFSEYENPELATTGNGPISDVDKQTLKYNLRKQDLYEQAYYFCDNLFSMGQVAEDLTSD